jgi:hypothetical protein
MKFGRLSVSQLYRVANNTLHNPHDVAQGLRPINADTAASPMWTIVDIFQL